MKRIEEISLREKIIKNRPLILWAETAALLHDIGKLSEVFLKYRQGWRRLEDGWNKDPHEHEFLDKHDKLIKESTFSKVYEWFNLKVNINGEDVSIIDVVHRHINPENNLFLKMINAADGKDAALDRNNPLFTADQTGKIFDTDVFGAELKNIEPSDIEDQRKQLYNALYKLELPDGAKVFSWKGREDLFETIRKHFDNENAFSDTTRPDNDMEKAGKYLSWETKT